VQVESPGQVGEDQVDEEQLQAGHEHGRGQRSHVEHDTRLASARTVVARRTLGLGLTRWTA
jgi:hypothetical protein